MPQHVIISNFISYLKIISLAIATLGYYYKIHTNQAQYSELGCLFNTHHIHEPKLWISGHYFTRP
jgi:hypothetical protein